MSKELKMEDVVHALESMNGEAIIPEYVFDTLVGNKYLTDDIYFMSPLEFPEPEKLWHYKLRMVIKTVKEIPSKIRWIIFPYHVIHKNNWRE